MPKLPLIKNTHSCTWMSNLKLSIGTHLFLQSTESSISIPLVWDSSCWFSYHFSTPGPIPFQYGDKSLISFDMEWMICAERICVAEEICITLLSSACWSHAKPTANSFLHLVLLPHFQCPTLILYLPWKRLYYPSQQLTKKTFPPGSQQIIHASVMPFSILTALKPAKISNTSCLTVEIFLASLVSTYSPLLQTKLTISITTRAVHHHNLLRWWELKRYDSSCLPFRDR